MLNSNTATRPAAVRPPADPPTPHPSWRMALAGSEPERPDRIVDAEDFWKRLGI